MGITHIKNALQERCFHMWGAFFYLRTHIVIFDAGTLIRKYCS